MEIEEIEATKSTMDLSPPPYPPVRSLGPKIWAWAVTSLLLLAVVVVGATLLGVYMTQKHTEAVVDLAFMADGGEKVQQTVMVNDKNMAAFYININNTSTTILYDYQRGIIGFRSLGENRCYVTKMKDAVVPTMAEILNSIKVPANEDYGSSKFIYNFLPGEVKADRTKLGVPINLLCSDQPIYWGSQDDGRQQSRWWDKLKNAAKNVVNFIKKAEFEVNVSAKFKG
ncbi:surfactant protein C-like [Gastrophryne carolinensis]